MALISLMASLALQIISASVTFTESGKPHQESEPAIPPAITSEDTSEENGGRRRLALMGSEFGPAAEDIRRRLMAGREIPEEYYEQCHFWVNAVRSREGLPALR